MSLNVVYLRLLGYYLSTKKAGVKNMIHIVEFCKISSLKLSSLSLNNITVWFSHSLYRLNIKLQKPKKFFTHNRQHIYEQIVLTLFNSAAVIQIHY